MNTPKTHPQKPSNTADETPNPQRFSGAWETKRLGEIAHIKTGSKNNEDKDENGRYPLFVRSATVERINSYCYDGEAILVPGEGGIGSIFHYINGRFDCHQRVYMINRFTDDMCGRLVYYNMMLQFGSHAMKNTVKATVDSLRLPTFKNFSLSIPKDTDEQRAIAEALSDVDGLLNALDALIAKKRAIKQAVMQQLLTGKTRLPSFSGAWETKRLGEIAPIRNHKTLPAYVNPATLCVELDNIEQRSGQLLEYAMARNSTSSKYHFCAGDVLFGRLRPYLRKFWHADRDGICTTEIWPLMVNRNQIDSGFLYGIVQSDAFIAAASISYGTHMPRADWNVMRNFEISLPEIQEQRAIAAILSDIDAEIAALEQRWDKTRAIKQGMMQQLLTGRVRLSESRICADDTD